MANSSTPKIKVKENGEPLVDLSQFSFSLEPMYYHKGFSSTPRMYLRITVAQRLEKIQTGLPNGYKFKIWDGWRPRNVQNNIYDFFYNDLRTKHPEWSVERVRQETNLFVSPATDPEIVPPHTTGGAVDLTIVDSSGDELNMGTDFDHLGPEAALLYYEENDLDTSIRQNRRLLREILERADFATYDGEWWDYNYGNEYWAETLGRPLAFFDEIADWPSES